jgi:hypothetical protein
MEKYREGLRGRELEGINSVGTIKGRVKRGWGSDGGRDISIDRGV